MQAMKLFVLLLAPSWAAKFLMRSSVTSEDREAPACPGNVLPDDVAAGPYKTLGKAQFADIIDPAKLRAALEGSEDWAVGKTWQLSVTANSMRKKAATFAFAGGGHGFLSVTVPGGAVDAVVSSTDTVKSLASETDFEYRGEDAVVTDDDVLLTNVCLRPITCESFKECKPSSDWKLVLAASGSLGRDQASWDPPPRTAASLACAVSTPAKRTRRRAAREPMTRCKDPQMVSAVRRRAANPSTVPSAPRGWTRKTRIARWAAPSSSAVMRSIARISPASQRRSGRQ